MVIFYLFSLKRLTCFERVSLGGATAVMSFRHRSKLPLPTQIVALSKKFPDPQTKYSLSLLLLLANRPSLESRRYIRAWHQSSLEDRRCSFDRIKTYFFRLFRNTSGQDNNVQKSKCPNPPHRRYRPVASFGRPNPAERRPVPDGRPGYLGNNRW